MVLVRVVVPESSMQIVVVVDVVVVVASLTQIVIAHVVVAMSSIQIGSGGCVIVQVIVVSSSRC